MTEWEEAQAALAAALDELYCAGFGEWLGACPNRPGLCERCRKAHETQAKRRALVVDRAKRLRKRPVVTAEAREAQRAAGFKTAALLRSRREKRS